MPFDETLYLLQTHAGWLTGICALLGLLVGSFLNVVIYRLPKMLEQSWKQEAQLILELPTDEAPRFNLLTPASRCPHCQHAITWYENIPVLSWLALRGRCAECGNRISARYPGVEITAAILAGVTAAVIGYGPWLALALITTWALLALTMIDLDTTLLPDQMTLPLMWAGLLAAQMHLSPVSLTDAVTGAAAGYLSLWSVYWLFKLTTGKEGMGYGDFKLLAALGALLGWQMLPLIILLSSVIGTAVAIVLLVTHRVQRDQGIPFGPYLAAAGWVAMLWGHDIVNLYLGMFSF